MTVSSHASPIRIVSADYIVCDSAGADAFAVCGENIIAVGTRRDLLAQFPNHVESAYPGKTIIPGLNDAHTHPILIAMEHDTLDLTREQAHSFEEVMSLIERAMNAAPDDPCVRVKGYDPTRSTGGRMIDRLDLDKVTGDRPLFVKHVSAVLGVANSAALKLAGLDDTSPDPTGGTLGRDAAGNLTGVLHGAAMRGFTESQGGTLYVAQPGPDRAADLLKSALAQYNSFGITSVGDCLVYESGLAAYQTLHRRGDLSVRVDMLLHRRMHEHAERIPMHTGLGDNRLRINGYKLGIDAGLTAGTCLVDEPFVDTASHGIQHMTDDVLLEWISRLVSQGNRVGVHANGDRAVRKVIDIFESAQKNAPKNAPRNRIEHCTIVDEEMVRRMAALNLAALPAASYPRYHGDVILAKYGESRVERMFAHRAFLDAGVTVGGSSDYPTGSMSPFVALASLVTRKTREGKAVGLSQRISMREALHVYTLGSAASWDQESYKGKIAAGYLADFVVLPANPLTIPVEEVEQIEVEETWVGGDRVWSAA